MLHIAVCDDEKYITELVCDYISEYYGGFYNGLVKICRDCEINNEGCEGCEAFITISFDEKQNIFFFVWKS